MTRFPLATVPMAGRNEEIGAPNLSRPRAMTSSCCEWAAGGIPRQRLQVAPLQSTTIGCGERPLLAGKRLSLVGPIHPEAVIQPMQIAARHDGRVTA